MSENKQLTPVWIIYADGRRLDAEHEGALREITVTDRLNGISEFSVVFNTNDVKVLEKGLISLESEISIHLGYKDDVGEVISGEVTAFQGEFSERGGERAEVRGCNALHRLDHARRTRSFEEKTASGIIKGITDGYSLKAEADEFGASRELQSEENMTDYKYLSGLARAYGKQVYASGDTVYVKDEITVRPDEIIYEWGKGLSSFKGTLDTRELVSGVEYAGWDPLKSEAFAGGAELKDIAVKVGGSKNWEDVSKGGNGLYVHTGADPNCKDGDEAARLALGLLQENSYAFGKAEGSGAGNYRLRPGMRVTVKAAGETFEGEYTAETVTHRLGRNGYTTEFTLKRNMC
jgi:phage protein D